MLKPEQANSRLDEWRLPSEQDRIKESIRRLPRKLSESAASAYGRQEVDVRATAGGWEKFRRRGREAVIQLDQLSPTARSKVFSVVSPKLAPAMENAWQLIKTAPYQSGYQKKAFRAPHHPQVLAEKLHYWMLSMAAVAQHFPGELLTPAWLAAWAPHLSSGYRNHGAEIGSLLAAVLRQPGAEAEEIFEILGQSLNSQHEIGAPGTHIYTAFLLSDRPAAWEAVEKTLLAAQRQEGLRQAILQTIDLAHPEAFRRMLGLIVEHDLHRFSSVVRAFDVWFGQLWSTASSGHIKNMLVKVIAFLDDPAARDQALRGNDPEAAFLALWCAGAEDAVASVESAEKLLAHQSVELRYVAACHLVNLDLDVASAALIPSLDDEDLRVALLAIPRGHYMMEYEGLPGGRVDDRFERLERLVERTPSKPQMLKPPVWPWGERAVKQSDLATCLVFTLGDRPATRLVPHLRKLEPNARRHAVTKLAAAKIWDDATRAAIVDLAGDASADVRWAALEALLERKLKPADIERLEGYLTRTASDLRRSVLALLLKQADRAVLASGSRLLAGKNVNQRLGGLELLRLMTHQQRSVAQCRGLAEAYERERPRISRQEQSHLTDIAAEQVAVPALEDALGLMNPAERSPVVPPRNLKAKFITPAAVACLQALDDLVHEHRETAIRCETYVGSQEELLGSIRWGFPGPDDDKPREGQEGKLPLAEVWMKWFSDRNKSLRDGDGLELVRSRIWLGVCYESQAEEWEQWAGASPARRKLADLVSGKQQPCRMRYPHVVSWVVEWLLFLFPCDSRDYLLDAVETAFSCVPAEEMDPLRESEQADALPSVSLRASRDTDWRSARALSMWSDALEWRLRVAGSEPTPAQQVRQWRLMHWRDEPFRGARRRRPDSSLLRVAYAAGAASLADVADQLLGPRGMDDYRRETFSFLQDVTARKPHQDVEAWLTRFPEVRAIVDRAIARILELELGRGDAPTAATAPAHSLGSLKGIETLRRILQALGKAGFNVSSAWRYGANEDRRQTLTQLAQITFPSNDETPGDFASVMRQALREGQFPEERLLQLTFLAPQWVKYVEAYLNWPQMSEGVYWFLAHLRYIGGLGEAAAEGAVELQADDERDREDAENELASDAESDGKPRPRKLSAWERLVLERTPLSNFDRDEGAIDVPWFQRTYALLKDKHWQQLATAARFAASPSQARRAAFIADVLLNRVSRQDLVDGITKRQLKDHVRLLGLLPLAKGKQRDADLQERCRILREYRRYANQLSGLTKPAALRAWEIGMRNLAQTAGYADPLRLEWAVGAEEVKYLATGPRVVEAAGVVVSLTIDDLAKPVVTVRRGDKILKSIPPAVKKDKKVAELTGHVTDLKRQAASIRQSLEAAMCRGDEFTAQELRNWCGHALLAPLLTRLVVIGEGIAGYPDKGGKALRDFAGKLEPIKPQEKLRLAHAHDLLESGDWDKWQRECFQTERVQPFKQVFRELYVVTQQECKDGAASHRYSGQQIQPRQSLALFGQRGWNTQDGIFKVFHDCGLTVSVGFDGGYGTPLEVEEATLAGVWFTKRDHWEPISLTDVPPRLFSEVMRDVDLVVSVAHAGEVDPEASASTVEMRTSLLRETCDLLNLSNVRFNPTHALVDGELANYTVHLGSGTVQKMPGGALCVVPVHSQHRGRLFLPFADDDPRTAEIISKVLLLARDREIQDPTILEQIRR